MTATLEATDIGVIELQELLKKDPLTRIIDVRTGGEYETLHIPGSYNVPLSTLSEHVFDLAQVEHPVVLVCQSGARAGEAKVALNDAGKSNLRILDGGMSAWQQYSGETIKGSDRWAMERQVRGAAGSMALSAVVLSILVPKAKWAAAGIGFGLLFSAVTNTCAMAKVLALLPYNKTDNCDIQGVLAELKA